MMDRIHVFAPPPGAIYTAVKNPTTVPIPPYPRGISVPRKRQRTSSPATSAAEFQLDDKEEEKKEPELSDDEVDATSVDNIPSKPAITISSHLRSTLDQFHTAGHPPDEPLPPSPFPVAPYEPEKPVQVLSRAIRELKALQPPLYHVPALRWAPKSLRETHLSVMNTVLHRSLLRGDYERAGRAFGLLMRAVPGGPRMLRRRDVCGIGAEILLRRRNRAGEEYEDDESLNLDDDDEDEATGPEGEPRISERSFELVKQYLELLITEHPPKTQLGPDQLGFNFYYQYFSFWIYQILERSKRGRGRTRDEDEDEDDHDDDVMSVASIHHISSIRPRELADARELAQRFDEVINQAPWDKNPDLLQLRAMVSQWIADLLPNSSSNDGSSSRESPVEPGFVDTVDDDLDLRSHELAIANRLFKRAIESR
jgi:RNA polymerase I-specific transcription initiation factor RRN11